MVDDRRILVSNGLGKVLRLLFLSARGRRHILLRVVHHADEQERAVNVHGRDEGKENHRHDNAHLVRYKLAETATLLMAYGIARTPGPVVLLMRATEN